MDSTDLEKALSNSGDSEPQEKASEQQSRMSREMEVGFHQGALNTLVNERNELIKMAQVTEQIMQAHIKRLEELGVKVNFGGQEGKK